LYRAIIEASEASSSYDGDFIGLLGWCYLRIGWHDEAIRTFATALAARSSSVDTAYLNFDLALATLAAGHTDLGRAEYDRAWQLVDDVPAARRRGLLNVARNDLVLTAFGWDAEAGTAAAEIAARFDATLWER
jgi:tetratricopeptide (TPR) repeat protein